GHIWHHVNPARRGPQALTGMVDLTRNAKGAVQARLVDLVPGRTGKPALRRCGCRSWGEDLGLSVGGWGCRSSDDGSYHTAQTKDLDVSKPTFTAPDLDSFCLVDQLGLTVTGQRLEPHRAVLECRVREDDPWCRDCGGQG